MIRYYCDKRSILSFLFFINLVEQVYYLYDTKPPRLVSPNKAWSKMTNFFKKLFTQETHWTEYYIEERKKLISKIEELKKVYKEEADIYLKEENRVMKNKMNSATSETEKYNLSAINSDVNERTIKDGMLGTKIRIYNYLKNLAETAQEDDIYLVEKILDIFISYGKENNIENSHKNWMEEQKNYVIKAQEHLKIKEKELQEREANIVKIEASHKILNSELADKLTINLK